jgi:miniconductance mechanosensitive channel
MEQTEEVTRFATALMGTIKSSLLKIGLSEHVVNEVDPFVFLLFIIGIAFISQLIVRLFFVDIVKRVLRVKEIKLLSILMQKSVLEKMSYMLMPLIIIVLIPYTMDPQSKFLHIVDKICWLYFVFMLADVLNALLTTFFGSMAERESLRNRPMKGFLQLLQVILVFVTLIVLISILLGKSPINLITGLGAFAAVLMLVFKDSILGFVAGVLLSQNDMIRIGDWIEIDSMDVNGTVLDISLNTVKVQNFDNTYVTVPPYTLISQTFINWRGMSESGGRRVSRSFDIDIDSIVFCTDTYLEEMKSIELLKDYITQKQADREADHIHNTDHPAGLVNGSIETNLGLFRAYMTLYLQQHYYVNNSLTLMVRTLAPSVNGLPLQVYCFCTNKDWVSYESIQAEIMEHFVAGLPRFGLYAFQHASGRDFVNNPLFSNKANKDKN